MISVKCLIGQILINSDNPSLNKFKCQKCMEFIFFSPTYQCKLGHWRCQSCWQERLNTFESRCFECDNIIESIEDLSRNIFIEKEFSQLQACCPNSYNGDHLNPINNIIQNNNNNNKKDNNKNKNKKNKNIFNKEKEEEEIDEKIIDFDKLYPQEAKALQTIAIEDQYNLNDENEEDDEEDQDEDENGEDGDGDGDGDDDDDYDDETIEERIKDVERGCPISTTVGELKSHLEICQFRFQKCKNEGCIEIKRKNDLEEIHYDINNELNGCKFNLMKCNDCKRDDIQKRYYQSHLLSCPKKVINCLHCDDQFERSHWPQHEYTQCKQRVISCTFKAGGCNQRFKRLHLPHHLKSINHIEFISKQYDSQLFEINLKNNLLLSKLNSISNENSIFQIQLKKQQKEEEDEKQKQNQHQHQPLQLQLQPVFEYKNKWRIPSFKCYPIAKAGLLNLKNKKVQNINYTSEPFEIGPFKFLFSIDEMADYEDGPSLHFYISPIDLGNQLKLEYSIKLLNENRKMIKYEGERLFTSLDRELVGDTLKSDIELGKDEILEWGIELRTVEVHEPLQETKAIKNNNKIWK
ncbi:hypothetical protein DDB_G0291023 [Dictyostelium discoideum AX4]|uniref:TRAF-type domain-containing protein n=1 Tax=Dictyostelium discoideum TaxID=44689 RepID=Q54F79_DICDI|nr:hypothetical protein DDB_G0291023 [Dictyostelium discoideum AX4]EAL61942.1 hypothetical protein DDB_G0291023 [Dictyostelium discoideum AX4]|eukprot:XP_635458.1 hypothetical protein DDB_G0291023 [Dictyostelium discoideum AX4]